MPEGDCLAKADGGRRSDPREQLVPQPLRGEERNPIFIILGRGLAFCQHGSHLTLTTPYEIQSIISTSHRIEEVQG